MIRLDIDRLKSQLVMSGIQQSNPALFQVINQLITAAQQIIGESNTTGTDTSGLQSTIASMLAANYLMSTDESIAFPNSRELLAGANVSFDDSTPNERVINVSQIFTEIDLVVTDAEILTLNSVPIELVPAPGAGFVIVPILLFISTDFAAGAYTAFNVTLDINGIPQFTGPTFTAGNRIYSEIKLTVDELSSNLDNQPLMILADVDPTGGNAANTMYVQCVYLVQPV